MHESRVALDHGTGPWHALNMTGKDWNLNIKRTALTLDSGSVAYRNFGRTQRQISHPSAWLVCGLFLSSFFGGACCGLSAVVLSASICRSFFEGPLALALGMHRCEATEG